MERVRGIIDNDERPSILVLMGDHGPWISRGVDNASRAFRVHDQHGIQLAVLENDTGCPSAELGHYAEGYITPSRLLAGLFRCLAAEPERLDDALDFGEKYAFRKYRYETDGAFTQGGIPEGRGMVGRPER